MFWLGASLISAYFLGVHPWSEELLLTHKDGFREKAFGGCGGGVKFRYVPVGSECQVSL